MTGSVDYVAPQPIGDPAALDAAPKFGHGLHQLTSGAEPTGLLTGQAGLFIIQDGQTIPQPPAPMPSITALATSGSPLIAQTSPDYSPLRNWFVEWQASRDLNSAIKSALTSIQDYVPGALSSFTTSSGELERRKPEIELARSALKWWKDNADTYFRQNPQQLDAAAADPLAFYRDTVEPGLITKTDQRYKEGEGGAAAPVRGVSREGKGDFDYTPTMAAGETDADAKLLGISPQQLKMFNMAVGGTGLPVQAILDQGFKPGDDPMQNEARIASIAFNKKGVETWNANRAQYEGALGKAPGLVSPQDLTSMTQELTDKQRAIMQAREAANRQLSTLRQQREVSVRTAQAAAKTGDSALYETELSKINDIDAKVNTLIATVQGEDANRVAEFSRTALTYASARAQINPSDVSALIQLAQNRGTGITNIQPLYGGAGYMVTDSAGNVRQTTLKDIERAIKFTFRYYRN